MNPVLFTLSLGDRALVMRAYSFFLVLGIVVALGLALVLVARAGLSRKRVAAVVVAAAVAALAGARVLNVALNQGVGGGGWDSLLDPGFRGLSLYGGLISAGMAGIGLALALSVPVWRLLDAMVPAVAAGVVLARAGCFLNGCCFGTPTDLPWGVSFPFGSLAWAYEAAYGRLNLFGGSSPVHPTQLYEMGGALVALALALWAGGSRWGRGRPGVSFLVFAALFSGFRWMNQTLRAPVFAPGVPDWFCPLLYGTIIVACCALLALKLTRPVGGPQSVR